MDSLLSETLQWASFDYKALPSGAREIISMCGETFSLKDLQGKQN